MPNLELKFKTFPNKKRSAEFAAANLSKKIQDVEENALKYLITKIDTNEQPNIKGLFAKVDYDVEIGYLRINVYFLSSNTFGKIIDGKSGFTFLSKLSNFIQDNGTFNELKQFFLREIPYMEQDFESVEVTLSGTRDVGEKALDEVKERLIEKPIEKTKEVVKEIAEGSKETVKEVGDYLKTVLIIAAIIFGFFYFSDNNKKK
jgi:hypothetical protein